VKSSYYINLITKVYDTTSLHFSVQDDYLLQLQISEEMGGRDMVRKKQNRKMEEASSSSSSARLSVLPLNELVAFRSPILDIVMGYVEDTNSLKSCRQVCSSWEEAAREALMSKSALNVTQFLNNVEPVGQARVGLYSSWILDYGDKQQQSAEREMDWIEFLREWGEGAKSLSLRGLTLNADCLVWIRDLLSSGCPNVKELSLEFDESQGIRDALLRQEIDEFKGYLDDGDTLKFRRIWKAKGDHAFAPYPLLPNIHSLRVGKKADRMTSFFSINVLLSCPDLKHLFVSELNMFEDLGFMVTLLNGTLAEVRGYCTILDFLMKRPDITMKLETFGWQYDDVRVCRSPSLNETVRSKLEDMMNASGRNALLMPFLQFGDSLNCLKSLHWNALHLTESGDLLFPGVLEHVAGNLRKLDLRVLRTDTNTSSQQALLSGCPGEQFCARDVPILCHHTFPSMPRLSVLQIGFRDCYKISLNELVDAAPNLFTLEVSASECCDIRWMRHCGCRDVDVWTGPVSGVLKRHTNLKVLKTGISLRSEMTLHSITKKFPNLAELWIGVEGSKTYWTELMLDDIFQKLGVLYSLKRFKWTINGPIDVAAILSAFTEAAEKMLSLETCHVRFTCPTLNLPYAVDDKRFHQNKAELLEKILRTKHSFCRFIVTTNSKGFATDGIRGSSSFLAPPAAVANTWNDIILPYIKRQNLPIEFHYSSAERDNTSSFSY
jgi:hypothetical protein